MTDALFDTDSAVGVARNAPTADTTPAAANALGAAAGEDGRSATREVAALRPTLNVVGVDLSLTGTGIATRNGVHLITSSGHHGDTLTERRQRLTRIRRDVLTWCQAADLVVIEAPSYGSRGGSQHDRSGLWWLVVSALHHRDINVIEISPKTRAKYATGNGNADKDLVLTAAVRRLPIDVDNNNTADAAWLCAIGYDLLDQPLCDLPATHRTALDAIRARFHESA